MEETVNTIEPAVETQNEQIAEPTPTERLNALMASRTGTFDVKISHADLKFLKNTLNQKLEWKGPNEAYLVIMAVLSIENLLQETDPKSPVVQVKVPATTIESVNFFLNKITGKGIESAQRLFSISMMFRQAVESIRKLDEEIEFVKNEMTIKKEVSEKN